MTTTKPRSNTARIRELNDNHRKAVPPINGGLVMTRGVSTLPMADMLIVLRMVDTFDDFTPDNDPHGEHNFGAITHKDVKYFWKIDYYDLQLEHHSLDPADPEVTKRVLTVMRADEY